MSYEKKNLNNNNIAEKEHKQSMILFNIIYLRYLFLFVNVKISQR